MIVTAADRRAVTDGCWYDAAAAERVRSFFRKFLRHSKGEWAGQLFEPLPWQWEKVIRPLFGWKRPDGRRRFNKGYIEIPKKNGKSTMCAGLSLYLLVGDGEKGSEVYSAAADRDQASIIYHEAASMVRSSPSLTDHVQIVETTKRLVFRRSGSFYKALSAEVNTKEGLNAHGVIVDELHAQKTRALWDTLIYSGAARRQPLVLAITTAGFDRESICWEQHEYARAILDGSFDDWSFFAYIAAASPEDDWASPEVWQRVNPSYGVTVKAEEMAEACKEAQRTPRKENSFKRYRLNLWTEQAERWLSMADWDACGQRFEEADLAGRECFVGMDLSSTTDVAAAAFVFPPLAEEDPWHVVYRFWSPQNMPRTIAEPEKIIRRQWAKEGFLKLTEGNIIDYDVIREDVKALAERFVIKEIAIDRWNATQITTQLIGDGFMVVPFGQGFASMSGPSKELEKLVLGGSLRHGGHPVARWMAANVAVEEDAAGNIKPTKSKSSGRIDAIPAMVMGLGRAMAKPIQKSVYEERGILVI